MRVCGLRREHGSIRSHPLPAGSMHLDARPPPMKDVFATTSHRPWPLPTRPWVMRQTWHDLLFAHWPVDAAALRPLLPEGLHVDTFEGQAWLGVVPFGMRDVFPRGTLAIPGLSAFLELNVRTYVTDSEGPDAKPGVWFFSLDAASRVAVRVARGWFHLPYFDADMRMDVVGDAVRYHSRRTHRSAPPAELRADYAATGPVRRAQPGTLEHWLTERYCLYTTGRGGRLVRGEIHHLPWPLQPAEAAFDVNTMADAAGLSLPSVEPLTHFAKSIDVAVWALEGIQPAT